MLRLQLDTGFIDLQEGVDVPIDLSFADVKEVGGKSGGFSYAFDIAGSAEVIRLLGGYFDVDLEGGGFNRNKKTEVTLLQDSEEVFTGYIQLMEVIRENATTETNSKKVKFKVSVFDEVSNFFNSMGDKELTDLRFTDLAHTFNRDTIIASWDNTEGYIYPQYAKTSPYTLRDFKPAIFELDYFKRIFESNGYTFDFDEATENHIRLDKRFIPYNGKQVDENISKFLQERFKVVGEQEEQTFAYSGQVVGGLVNYPRANGTILMNYASSSAAKLNLTEIIQDSQSQWLTGDQRLQNKAGDNRTISFNTSYGFDVKVRAVGGAAWKVKFNTAGQTRVDVGLFLVAQSVTDPAKVAIIDAGAYMTSFINDNTYEFAAGYQPLGNGVNASTVDLGLFNADEQIHFHYLMMGKYINFAGNVVNSATFISPIEFVDAVTEERVMLEFDITVNDARFQSIPDIVELVRGAGVDPSMFIPRKIKQRDLIGALSKTYNLIFEPDREKDNNIIIKTRDKYYDNGEEWDWSDKFDESQPSNITFLSNSFGRRQIYKYKDDKDVLNQAYQDEYAESYGQADVTLDNEYLIGSNAREIIYSATPSIESGLSRALPAINGVNPDCNIRVLYNQGKKPNGWDYRFYDDITLNEAFRADVGFYLGSSMYDDDVTPNFSLLFNSPRILFHDRQRSQTSNYLYNTIHKRELTNVNKGKMLTGYFRLTPSDFAKLSNRLDYKIFIKDNGWFYISKIHKYNANKKTLTKVELVTADDETNIKFVVPFTSPNLPPIKNKEVKTHNAKVQQDTNIIISKSVNTVDGAYNVIVGDHNHVVGDENVVLSNKSTVIGDRNKLEVGSDGAKVFTSDEQVTEQGTFVDEELKRVVKYVEDDYVEEDYVEVEHQVIKLNTFKNYTIVNTIEDLPTADAGVIYLEGGKTYVIASNLDLEGARLETKGDANLFGFSSETSSLTSTGLGVGVPLVTSIYSLVLQSITFKDVDTAISIDGNTNIVALDWQGVNFMDVPNIGTVNSCDNITFISNAFLGSKGFKLTGTIGTVGVLSTLFRGDGLAGNIIELDANCVVTRRFRISLSSVVAFADTVGINVNVDATIPTEAYILKDVNFSGGGVYQAGVLSDSNKTLFSECVGISNTAVNGQMFMNDNATATTITNTTDFFKVAGVTIPSDENEKYDHANNRLTNRAVIERKYLVQATLSFNAGNGNVCEFGFFDSELNDIRTPSKTKATANAAGRAESVSLHCVIKHEDGDFIEVHARNTTATTDITVTDMNVVITEIK